MKDYKEQLQKQREELEIMESIVEILEDLNRRKEAHYMREIWEDGKDEPSLEAPDKDDWRYNAYMAHTKVIEAIEKLIK